jgi:hypothetical protein
VEKWLVCILFVLWFFLGMIATQLGEIIDILKKKPVVVGRDVKFKDVWAPMLWIWVSLVLAINALCYLLRDALK